MKRPRKIGPGRKSKREIELAAQQARESAILAEMGFPIPKSGSISNSTGETIQTRQVIQQQYLGGAPSTSDNAGTNNFDNSKQRFDSVSFFYKL